MGVNTSRGEEKERGKPDRSLWTKFAKGEECAHLIRLATGPDEHLRAVAKEVVSARVVLMSIPANEQMSHLSQWFFRYRATSLEEIRLSTFYTDLLVTLPALLHHREHCDFSTVSADEASLPGSVRHFEKTLDTFEKSKESTPHSSAISDLRSSIQYCPPEATGRFWGKFDRLLQLHFQ